MRGFLMLLCAFACSSGAAMVRSAEYRVVDAFGIAGEPACMPAATRAPGSGDVLVGFGTEWEPFPWGGVVKLARSTDGGRTWSAPEVILKDDDPRVTYQTANGLQSLSNGDILFAVQRAIVPKRKNPRPGAAAPGEIYDVHSKEVVWEVRLLRSTDDGRTWTPEDPKLPRAMRHAGRIVETSDRRLILPVYEWTQGGASFGAYHVSRDFGKTWGPRQRVTPPMHPGFNETNVVQAADGSYFAIMRQEEMEAPRRTFGTAFSRDLRTWSNYQWTTIRGKMPDALVLPSGRILLAVGAEGLHDGSEVRARRQRRSFDTVFVSDDHGKTWKRDVELQPVDAKTGVVPADAPVMCLLDDGRILVVAQAIDRDNEDPNVGHDVGMSLIGNILQPTGSAKP